MNASTQFLKFSMALICMSISGVAFAGSMSAVTTTSIQAGGAESCQLRVSCYGELNPTCYDAYPCSYPFVSSLPLIVFRVPININQPPPSPYGIYLENYDQMQAMQISCNFMRYNATESGGMYYGGTYFPGYSVNWNNDSKNNWVELDLDCTSVDPLNVTTLKPHGMQTPPEPHPASQSR